MQLNIVNVLIIRFLSALSIFFLEFTLDRDDFVLLCTLEENVVFWGNFQVVARLKRVHHLLILLLVKNHSFVNGSQGHNIETRFGQDAEIFLAWDEEPFYFTFPKLETLMSEESDLIIGFIVDIHNSYIA